MLYTKKQGMTDQASGHAIYTFLLHMIQIIGRRPAILQIYVNAQKPEISSKLKHSAFFGG